MLELGNAAISNGFTRRRTHRFDRLPSGALDRAQHTDLTRCDKQYRLARAPGASGSPNAMNIAFDIVGNVVIDHMADARHIQTARRDIGRNHDVELFVLELLHRFFALRLVQIPVKGGAGIAARFQFLSQLNRRNFGAHEDQSGINFLNLQNARQRIQFMQPADLPVALADGLHRTGLGFDAQLNRRFEMLLGHHADLLRHRRREQRGLARGRSVFENPVHLLEKAHAQHFVRFIQYQGTQFSECQTLTAQMIHDPPRRAHDHMHCALQTAQLLSHALAAIDRQHVETRQVSRVALKRFRDLDREFTGGGQDQHLGFALLEIEAG